MYKMEETIMYSFFPQKHKYLKTIVLIAFSSIFAEPSLSRR